MTLLLTLLLACASPEAPSPAPPVDGAQQAPVRLDRFRAVAHDGQPRDIRHLRGHPTVVWFYPKAATGG